MGQLGVKQIPGGQSPHSLDAIALGAELRPFRHTILMHRICSVGRLEWLGIFMGGFWMAMVVHVFGGDSNINSRNNKTWWFNPCEKYESQLG